VSDALLEAARDQLHKLVEFFLLVLRVLCFLDKPNNFLLDVFWQFEVAHRCINGIDLFLQDDGFFVDVVH
jgi:hypothetical protein